MWGWLDMTRLEPPATAQPLNPREQLELYTAMAQFRFGMVALGVYFCVLILFLFVVRYIAKDNQLTLAVLLLQPITLLIGGVGAFWFQRARSMSQEAGGSVVTMSSAPGGGSSTTVQPAPGPAVVPVAAAAGGDRGAAIAPGGGEDEPGSQGAPRRP